MQAKADYRGEAEDGGRGDVEQIRTPSTTAIAAAVSPVEPGWFSAKRLSRHERAAATAHLCRKRAHGALIHALPVPQRRQRPQPAVNLRWLRRQWLHAARLEADDPHSRRQRIDRQPAIFNLDGCSCELADLVALACVVGERVAIFHA